VRTPLPTRTPVASLACAAFAACSTLPDYQRPAVAVPAHYAAMPGWSSATPSDTLSRGPWWSMFRDPDLDRLEARVDVSNQTIAKAVSQLQQARAMIDYQRAGFWPTVTAGCRRAARARRRMSWAARSRARPCPTTRPD
jgi:outer membrane protein TolC